MRKGILCFLVFGVITFGLAGGCDDEADGDGDADVDGDVDGDVDSDGDSDTDGDSDADTDGDGDGDGDADTDGDADGDIVSCEPTGTATVDNILEGTTRSAIAWETTRVWSMAIYIPYDPGSCSDTPEEYLLALYLCEPSVGTHNIVVGALRCTNERDAGGVWMEDYGADDQAIGGTVEITALSHDCIAGTFDLDTSVIGRFTGEFDAVMCR